MFSPGSDSVRGGIFFGRFSGVDRPNLTELGEDIGLSSTRTCLFQSSDILLNFQTRFAQNLMICVVDCVSCVQTLYKIKM